MNDELTIVDVSLRDGLQNEEAHLSTSDKCRLFDGLVAAGFARLEVTSFVNPLAVPQLADADEVYSHTQQYSSIEASALVVNSRGMERAVSNSTSAINYVLVATDTLSVRNQGTNVSEAIETWRRVANRASETGISTTLTLAAAFGCPFEGHVSADQAMEVLERALAAEFPGEIALADTIGCAVPNHVTELLGRVRQRWGSTIAMRCHLHNTRNTGYANAIAAVSSGQVALDASLGGIGGCPFAPASTGNIATEDLVWALHRMGYDTGLDLQALVELSGWLESRLGKRSPALLPRAGAFP